MAYNKPTWLLRLYQALHYSLDGLCAATKNEAAFRQELVLLLAGVIAVFMYSLTGLERILLIGSLLLVLIVELLNSAIEAVVDRISDEIHPLSKRAKDYGSAAVLLALANAALWWGVIFWGHYA